MNHLRRLIENTEQMPELARGLAREAARGADKLAAYATAEGYPVSVEDIVTAAWSMGRASGTEPTATELDLADGGLPSQICMQNPMLGLFRWYRQTLA